MKWHLKALLGGVIVLFFFVFALGNAHAVTFDEYKKATEKGIELVRNGNPDQAIIEFNKVLTFNPDDVTGCIHAGLAYSQKKDYEKAIDFYSRALASAKDPKTLGLAFELRGAAYFQLFNLGASKEPAKIIDLIIADYTKAMEFNPTNFGLYLNRGYAYTSKNGVSDLAVADFLKAIELNPTYAGTYDGLARAYYQKKDYTKAWDNLRQAKKLGSQAAPDFLAMLEKASGQKSQL